MQVMDFRVFESVLGSLGSFPLFFGHYNLEINMFRISYTIIFYPFLFHFYISCLDQLGIREKTQMAWVFTPEGNAVHEF